MLSVKVSPENLRAAVRDLHIGDLHWYWPKSTTRTQRRNIIEVSEGGVSERDLTEGEGRRAGEKPGVQEGDSEDAFKNMLGTTAIEHG